MGRGVALPGVLRDGEVDAWGSPGLPMPFTIEIHDAWGTVKVRESETLQEAQQVFADLCQDPWYRRDGGVKGLALVRTGAGVSERLAWFPFQ
jgi:hypothetical protein